MPRCFNQKYVVEYLHKHSNEHFFCKHIHILCQPEASAQMMTQSIWWELACMTLTMNSGNVEVSLWLSWTNYITCTVLTAAWLNKPNWCVVDIFWKMGGTNTAPCILALSVYISCWVPLGVQLDPVSSWEICDCYPCKQRPLWIVWLIF